MLYEMPIIQLLKMSKFKRCSLLARSLKEQRDYLKKAREALKRKDVYRARILISCYNDERSAWKCLVAIDSKNQSTLSKFI